MCTTLYEYGCVPCGMYVLYVYNCDFHGLLSHFQKKINMARGLEQGNMKHFVVSPAGDFLAFQGRILTTSAAISKPYDIINFYCCGFKLLFLKFYSSLPKGSVLDYLILLDLETGQKLPLIQKICSSECSEYDKYSGIKVTRWSNIVNLQSRVDSVTCTS